MNEKGGIKMKAKKLGLIGGIIILAVLLGIGLRLQFKHEGPPELTQLIKEEPVKPGKSEAKLSPPAQVEVKQEPQVPSRIEKIEVKQEEKEPLFIQKLKAAGIEVKEYKEMSAMGKLMNEYYKNQGYPRLEREFNTQIPEGEATGRIIVKEIDWNDDGSYSVRYYTVRVGDGQEVSAIENLKDEPSVVGAEPDFKIKIQSAVKLYTGNPPDREYDPFFENQWGLTAIKAPQAWEEVEGSKDIKIAILDSGVDLEHPDLVDNVDLNLSCDYINDDAQPEDEHPQSHGTHIAGIIAGKGFNGIGIHGVMNSATLIIHKILKGEVTDVPIITLASTISQAIVKGARVINMSWVAEDDLMAESATLKDIFESAFNNEQVLLVAAAGNGGKVLYPAKYPKVLSVGGVDEDGNVVGFEESKDGLEDYLSEVDVLAPGVNIYSTVVRKDDGSEEDGYGYLSGTSQAAAFVSGLAGLLLAKNPDLTKEELKQIITENAEDAFGLGKGLINAQSAVGGVTGGGGGEDKELQAVAYVGEKGQKEITVQVGDEVQFYGDESQAPEGYEVRELNFQWDFGDGVASDEINPAHTYQEAGEYTVFLVVSVGDESDADFVTVNVEDANTEIFGVVKDEEGNPVEGATVVLKYNIVYDEEGRVTECEVKELLTDENGEYSILFNIENFQTVKISACKAYAEGYATEEKELKINPGEKRRVDFTLYKVPKDQIWVQGKVYDENGNPQEGVTVWMRLKNKDGVGVVYTNAISDEKGNYKIVFEVPDPAAKYDVDLLEPEEKENILTDVEGGNSYTYNIGNASENHPPVINDINYEPENPLAGEEITFTADAEDPDGEIVAYNWDFGDGNTTEGQEVKHTYENEGTYTVKLTVTDDKGATASRSLTIGVGDVQVHHMVCQNDRCVQVDGPGTNECSTDSDCQQPPEEECENDDDCPSGYLCFNGDCVLKLPVDECNQRCTSWTEAGCGGGSCNENEMAWVRACPPGCSYLPTFQCSVSSECGSGDKECNPGEKRCISRSQYQVCSEFGHWSQTGSCPGRTKCEGGECVEDTECPDRCKNGCEEDGVTCRPYCDIQCPYGQRCIPDEQGGYCSGTDTETDTGTDTDTDTDTETDTGTDTDTETDTGTDTDTETDTGTDTDTDTGTNTDTDTGTNTDTETDTGTGGGY